jgi:hypothetical protein
MDRAGVMVVVVVLMVEVLLLLLLLLLLILSQAHRQSKLSKASRRAQGCRSVTPAEGPATGSCFLLDHFAAVDCCTMIGVGKAGKQQADKSLSLAVLDPCRQSSPRSSTWEFAGTVTDRLSAYCVLNRAVLNVVVGQTCTYTMHQSRRLA